MNLVIVESPTKAKTLSKYLGSEYKVVASMGHLRDLPKDRLGIDVNHDFKPTYQVMADHKKIIAELKEQAEKAKSVILATDPDREGEAIAWHIAELLKLNSDKKLSLRGVSETNDEAILSNKKIATAASGGLAMTPGRTQRITFHEITESAIKEALMNPGQINLKLVDAQQARRVLDRLVGYKLSPLLWSKVRRGLSAGRVQSVALRFIVEREREIENFKTEEYWTIVANLKSGQENKTEFELISKDGIKYETSQTIDLYDGKYTWSKTTTPNKEQADLIINDINKYSIYVSDIDKKGVKRSPLPPFTTSTMQQESGRKLGYSAKKTMQLAQKLYENGFITYHRTDSVNLAAEAVNKCRDYIIGEFGKEYLPESPRFFKVKQKLAQEAHEAIRPTRANEITNAKLQITNEIGRDAERLYELIWKRFVACQMTEALIERTTVFAKTAENINNLGDLGYLFKANGSVVTFPGFLKVYPEALEDKSLAVFEKGEELLKEEIIPLQHFTQPPPRYNEASLIATLEEKGIGRPSTYAPTLSTIQDRHYVEKEEKKLKPNALGMAVNDFLVQNFSEIDDVPFTAKMEDESDEIASGKREWVGVIKEFFTPFSDKLQGIYKTAQRVKIETEETNEKCDLCGSPLVVRIGRFGKFLACSKFPECKFTKNLMVSTGLKCPEDGGDVVIRRTKRGKTFYGCGNYPKCKWASWTKPR